MRINNNGEAYMYIVKMHGYQYVFLPLRDALGPQTPWLTIDICDFVPKSLQRLP
jgi:hypothetical protein